MSQSISSLEDSLWSSLSTYSQQESPFESNTKKKKKRFQKNSVASIDDLLSPSPSFSLSSDYPFDNQENEERNFKSRKNDFLDIMSRLKKIDSRTQRMEKNNKKEMKNIMERINQISFKMEEQNHLLNSIEKNQNKMDVDTTTKFKEIYHQNQNNFNKVITSFNNIANEQNSNHYVKEDIMHIANSLQKVDNEEADEDNVFEDISFESMF